MRTQVSSSTLTESVFSSGKCFRITWCTAVRFACRRRQKVSPRNVFAYSPLTCVPQPRPHCADLRSLCSACGFLFAIEAREAAHLVRLWCEDDGEITRGGVPFCDVLEAGLELEHLQRRRHHQPQAMRRRPASGFRIHPRDRELAHAQGTSYCAALSAHLVCLLVADGCLECRLPVLLLLSLCCAWDRGRRSVLPIRRVRPQVREPHDLLVQPDL